MLTSPCFSSPRHSCIASGRTWRTQWRRASRRRTSRCGPLSQPLCTLCCCWRSEAQRAEWEARPPCGQLALPSYSLLLQPLGAPCLADVRRTQPARDFVSLLTMAILSSRLLCARAPWHGASGKSLPKRPWEPGTSSCPLGSPGLCPCTGH